MTINARRLELALASSADHRREVTENHGPVNTRIANHRTKVTDSSEGYREVNSRLRSRIAAIPSHSDIESDRAAAALAGVIEKRSERQRSRNAYVGQVINSEIMKRHLEQWIAKQDPHPNLPERVIVRNEEGEFQGSIRKDRICILQWSKAVAEVIRHANGLPRLSETHTLGCVLDVIDYQSEDEWNGDNAFFILDRRTYEQVESAFHVEVGNELLQAYIDGIIELPPRNPQSSPSIPCG